MATINEIVSHIYTNEASLATVPVKYGQLIICSDSEKMYIDKDRRISLGDLVIVETSDALPIAPLDKFYIAKDTNRIYVYLNGSWKSIQLDTNIDDAVRRYPATIDSESKIVTITDGTPVANIRIGDEIVTSEGVYKKVKDSITTAEPEPPITDSLDLFEYASLPADVVRSINGISPDSDGIITLPDATTTASGLMSTADKAKLDGISVGGSLESVSVSSGLTGDGTSTSPLKLNLANYQENNTIKLTSTAGAVNLIANTSEVALYSGSSYVKANLTNVELQGTTVTLNGNQPNTAGGLVITGDDGKILEDLIPSTSGGVTVVVSETEPENPTEGMIWIQE